MRCTAHQLGNGTVAHAAPGGGHQVGNAGDRKHAAQRQWIRREQRALGGQLRSRRQPQGKVTTR